MAQTVMVSADFMGLPVHAGGLFVIDLHPVGTVVLDTGLWVLSDDQGQGDEGAAV